MQKEPITVVGFEKIQEELDHLIKVEREALKIQIHDARELGDLKENAEYHSAKEKQGHIEGRIAQIQAVIASAQVIDIKDINNDKIVFGATVSLINSETDETVTYQIVGDFESDIKQGLVSYKSPLGKALIGKEEGDSIVVKAPKGDIEYDVESIKYGA